MVYACIDGYTKARRFMRKNAPNNQQIQNNQCYLPDFCQSETNLLLILVLELIAIVLALASAPVSVSTNLFIHLALISIYIQWIGLSSAALLCLCGRLKLLEGTVRATGISLLVVALVILVLALLAFQLNAMMQLELFNQSSVLTVVIHHEAIGLVLYGLSLRYFYVQYSARQVIKAESHSRLQALQARIRPHFLFNSLNTIASLTHAEPDKAERAIEDLAELFRASLNADTQISLLSEIELTKDYINLESLRLDDRLRVNWEIDPMISELTMPALILQPLVENAIYHGIEPLQEVLQIGKEDVNITQLEPVGHYAINLMFDDNHDSGIYSWEYLYQLGAHYDKKWETYLERLKASGYTRKVNKLEI